MPGDPSAIARLRADLAPFTVDAVESLFGPLASAALGREQSVPAILAVERSSEPIAALVAAFVLGRPVSRQALDAALPQLGTDGAVRLGLAEAAGQGPADQVRPIVDLRPYAAVDAAGTAHWWVASDLAELATGAPLRPDHVLGVGGASVTLARCTIRRPVGSVLDLGTGCGVQALHARRHARRVTATDLSARALAFARFTLALNRGLNPGDEVPVELLEGSLLEPVAGRQFDLVVSNPPFVITPRRPDVPAYEYRDGGLVGDALVERLVAGVGAVLAPGGVAQLLGNWEHRRGTPWQERVGAWLDASGLDGWIVQREVQDVAQYAETWIRDGGLPDPPRYAELYRAWLADFEARQVEAVGFGMITLRRPAADPGSAGGALRGAGSGTPAGAGRPPLRRLEELAGPLDRPVGDHLADCLDAADWLAATGDEALLASRLVVASDVTEERHHRPGEEDPSVILLRQGGGFGRVVRVGSELAAVVGACDGELALGPIIGAVAQLVSEPVDAVQGAVVPALRALVADGFARPARDG